MRILDVSPRVAYPPARGSAVRVWNLLARLARRHEVVGFSQERTGRLWAPRALRESCDGSYTELRFSHPLAALVGEVSERAWTSAPLFAGAALRLARPERLDELLAWAGVVLVEFPWQHAHCRRRRPAGPLVYSSHNVEAVKFASYAEAVGARLTRRAWLSLVRRVEAEAVARSELVLAVSEEDRHGFVDGYGADPSRVVVVPNGADTARYRPTSPAERAAARRQAGLPERATVFFAGSDVPPNRVGAEWVRRLARRERRFTFLVVGPVGRPCVEGSLVQTGRVPDLGLYLRASDLALVPIAHGGGTKIKLLESLAAGLPTVAFEEALGGTDIRDGDHLVVTDKTADALLEALHTLVDDVDLAARLGAAGRRLVEERYDWDAIAVRLEAALESLLPGAATRPIPSARTG